VVAIEVIVAVGVVLVRVCHGIMGNLFFLSYFKSYPRKNVLMASRYYIEKFRLFI